MDGRMHGCAVPKKEFSNFRTPLDYPNIFPICNRFNCNKVLNGKHESEQVLR
jgi:hypothetical protein